MAVFWHRRDLRTEDNRGLAAAAADGPLLPVYVLDDDVLAHASPVRVAFLLDALAALRGRYRALGGDLLVVRGDPADALVGIADEHGEDRVVWSADYSDLARRRDDRVRDALGSAGLEGETVHDALLHEPGTVRTNAGDPYQVFGPFERKWRSRAKADPVDEPDPIAAVEGEPLPSRDDLGFDEPGVEVPDAGQSVARERLEAFCDGPIYAYAAERDYPARDATSRLSPHLTFGTVGIRTVWAATEDALAEAAGDDERESVEEYRSQLAWRDFYAHVLRFNPETVAENYVEYERPIEWRNDPEELAAWKAGETGFPIVDAGMRQLLDEAWMHNRVRMIVASFLTKDLLVDWRHGYRHFREHLVDHDTANDVGGWQWAASTGTDAQPYFRIFNPMTQGERYDPDAEYIQTYVPELRGVEPSTVHAWPALEPAERDAAAPGYPAPIVDHAERREAALETFEAARGS